MKKINILFVCRYNRFRSRVAEAYFKKINKNKNVQVKSAGLIKGTPVAGKGARVAKKKYRFDIYGKTHGLMSKVLAWQDITVIVADDVPPQVFDRNKKYGKKVLYWKIKDVDTKSRRTPEKVIEEIVKRVNALVKLLERRR